MTTERSIGHMLMIMTFADYAINAALVLLVLVQVRDRRLDLWSIVLPVAAVAGAAFYYLRGVPTAGHDVLLDVVLGSTGLVLGVSCALTTRVWRAGDGFAHCRAGIIAALLWVVGVGGRFAFQEYSTHGGAGPILRFSVAHQIDSSEAWVAALVIMALSEVLARMAVLRLRGAMTPGRDVCAGRAAAFAAAESPYGAVRQRLRSGRRSVVP
jgi:hypothetical protein